MKAYFMDSYALHELFAGNEGYKKFEKEAALITTRLNLMEFYYTLLRLNSENVDQYYDRMLRFAVEIADDTIKKAMKFRLRNKAKDLSYVDAVGYILAMEKNVKFVTGDQQFKDMENVEFIK